ILNSELRLISPIEPEGSESDGQIKTPVGEKFFLLTHDYLVPSIREWLTRKKKETRRGRAELRLVDRSSLWNAKPENRQLPSALEWANIRMLTKKKDWTEPQRKMMKRAGRVQGLRTLATVLVLTGLGISGISIRIGIGEANQETQAQGLVQRLLDADTAQVPEIVKAMSDHRRWVDSSLRSELERSSDDSRQKLHASLALLPVDTSQVDYLFNRLIKATPSELPVLRDALKKHQSALTSRLWNTLESAKPSDASLLPSASALASYSPDDARWESAGGKVAQALVSVNAVFLGPWIEALRLVRGKLTAPLATIFRDRNRSESERAQATDILADYAKDDPDLIADLLMDADTKAYAAFFPIAQRQESKTVRLLQVEIAKKATISDSNDSEMTKDRLAERQARAAVALVRMGHAQEVWPLLRHSADPRLRSFIVNWLNPLGADPRAVVAGFNAIDPSIKPTPVEPPKRMDAILFHPETSMRRALILALGTYGTEGLSTADREPLISKLLDLYRNDPDSGVHGAVEWTLRRWTQQEKLKAIDSELMTKEPGEHRWFVNGQRQTFAVIEGPVEFSMGSPPTEPDRSSMETLHRRRISRRFALAIKEVSVEQYQRFQRLEIDAYSPDPDGPMNGPSWYDAAAYCNWLSERDGLDKAQWCYEPNPEGKYAVGMKMVTDFLGRSGYRLPTEAEWEYACRSGSVTSRYYGVSVQLLGQYAWYNQNSRERARPCGLVKPNDLGLFDMLGNVYERCQEQYEGAYPAGKDSHMADDMIRSTVIDTYKSRIIRGGSFNILPANVRSANRHGHRPSNRSTNCGFRPCRTYP
ncbi:MAG: formylglycine-generating enzyme family protein, partial [Isosphaeraceae bacterium]